MHSVELLSRSGFPPWGNPVSRLSEVTVLEKKRDGWARCLHPPVLWFGFRAGKQSGVHPFFLTKVSLS